MSEPLRASAAHDSGVIRRGWRLGSRESALWCQTCGRLTPWTPRYFERVLHATARLHQREPDRFDAAFCIWWASGSGAAWL